jgi:FixJ family two-component response regulator
LTAELIGYGLVKSRRPREAAPAGRSRTGPALLSKRKLVFVVDDDPGMLRGVQRLLREHGYDSMSFSSADAFQKHDNFEQAVCVVLDINLNDESGIEVRHRLKAAGIFLPVIYITGKDDPATRMAAIESGCLAYLTKPFAAKSLIEPIERASTGRA